MGNGASRSITGVGFQPDVLMVKVAGSGVADSWFRTKDMAANVSHPVRSDVAGATGRITSLDADGFSLGTDNAVNQTLLMFNYMALKDHGRGDFSTVTYTGDNTDDKLVFTAWQPTFALLKANSTIVGAMKFKNQTSALATPANNFASMQFQSGPDRADLMGFLSGGLHVSNGSSSGGNLVNVNAVAYYGFAMNDVPGYIATGSYTGTGVVGNAISTGFTPLFIVIHATTSQPPVVHWGPQAGNETQAWDSATSTARLASISSSGFTVSANDGATNSSGVTYHWMATASRSLGTGNGFLASM